MLTSVMLIYIAAAIVPAIALLIYVYKQDKVEQEPPQLIGKLILYGVFAALAAIVLEIAGEAILNQYVNLGRVMKDTDRYYFILAFLIVAVAEEGTKAFFTYRGSWNDPNFDYHFDGIVYAVSVSLGFAAFENVKYVMSYGLSVALPRAFLAIPGHMSFAVLFGVFYARAKYYNNLYKATNDTKFKRMQHLEIAIGYILAVLIHGAYDSCAMIGTQTATLIYVGVVIVMYIICFVLVRRESRGDYSLSPTYPEAKSGQ